MSGDIMNILFCVEETQIQKWNKDFIKEAEQLGNPIRSHKAFLLCYVLKSENLSEA